ncbi:MAG: response regulator [Myxococcota bacterium]
MSKTILLADDSVTIQKVVGLTIANQDYKLVAVGDGEEAIKRVKELSPDIVIADAVMPKKNGYEVCRTLKTSPSTAKIPVIILAGTFEPYDEVKGKEVGVDAVIIKPFESAAFLNTVAKTLATAPAKPTAAPPPQPKIEDVTIVQKIQPTEVAAAELVEEAPAEVEIAEPIPQLQPKAEEFDFGDINIEETESVPTPKSPPPAVKPPKAEKFEEPEAVSFDSFQESPLAVEPLSIPEAEGGEFVTGVEVPESKEMPEGGLSVPDVEPLSREQLTIGVEKAAETVAKAVQEKVEGDADAATIEKITREEIQKVIWDIVPELAEAIIREEINRLLRQKTGV